jgi:hypothetical protein
VIWGLKDRIRAEYWLYRLELLMEEHEEHEAAGHMCTFDPSLKPIEFEKPGKVYQKQWKCEHCAPCIHLPACSEALRAIGVPAIPALKRKLWHDDLRMRWESLRFLEEMGPPAVPALCEALLNGDPTVRAKAARTLGQLNSERFLAISALLRSLGDEVESVRRSAGAAMETRFPFSNDVCFCAGPKDEAARMVGWRIPVRYCPDCRTAKETWRKGR